MWPKGCTPALRGAWLLVGDLDAGLVRTTTRPPRVIVLELRGGSGGHDGVQARLSGWSTAASSPASR
jgi:hypothetical protein